LGERVTGGTEWERGEGLLKTPSTSPTPELKTEGCQKKKCPLRRKEKKK